MGIKEVYEEVLPYLSDPKTVWEFLEENKEGSREEIIRVIEMNITDSEGTLKTDLRILLNALMTQE
jgi:hypothetical protein